MIDYREKEERTESIEINLTFEILEKYFNVKKENIKKDIQDEVVEDGYYFVFTEKTNELEEWEDGHYFCTNTEITRELSNEQLNEINEDLSLKLTHQDVENFLEGFI